MMIAASIRTAATRAVAIHWRKDLPPDAENDHFARKDGGHRKTVTPPPIGHAPKIARRVKRRRSQVNNATSTTSSQDRTDRVEADGCAIDTETLAGG